MSTHLWEGNTIQPATSALIGTLDAGITPWIKQSACPLSARRLTLNKQNPRISVGDECYIDNYTIGHLLGLIGQKDDSRATFKLSSPQEGSCHAKMEKQGL